MIRRQRRINWQAQVCVCVCVCVYMCVLVFDTGDHESCVVCMYIYISLCDAVGDTKWVRRE